MKNSCRLNPIGYRKPRTTQEKSVNYLYRIEGGKVRPKRYGKNLPEVYDDIYVSRISSKSWKYLYKKRKPWQKVKIKPNVMFPYAFRNLDEDYECPSLEKFKEASCCFSNCPFYDWKYKYCLKFNEYQKKRIRTFTINYLELK